MKNLPNHLMTEDEIMKAYCEYVVGGGLNNITGSQVREAASAVLGVAENLSGMIAYNWAQQKKK